MFEKITWPVVALVGLVLTAIVLLSALDADTTVITNVIVLLGLGSGIGVLSGIKSNVNGNLSRLIGQLGDAMDKLSRTPPVVDPPSKEVQP